MPYSSTAKRLSAAFVVSLALLVGCSKKENGPVDASGNPASNTPRTQIPAQYSGTWYTGTVSPTNFYNSRTGGSWTNAFGTGMFYTLNADGTFEFGWQVYANTYGCATRGMVYRRGTATIADSVITLHDNFARVSGQDNCVASSNYDRPRELQTETIILRRAVDEYGNQGMEIRNPDNEYSWFRPI